MPLNEIMEEFETRKKLCYVPSKECDESTIKLLRDPDAFKSTTTQDMANLDTHMKQHCLLCPDIVCNELALIRKRGVEGNLSLLTATVYGIPYGFLVSRKPTVANSECSLEWCGYERSCVVDVSKSYQLNSPPPIPLPLRWNIGPYPKISPVKFSPSPVFSASIRWQLNKMNTDPLICKTVLLFAKELLWVG